MDSLAFVARLLIPWFHAVGDVTAKADLYAEKMAINRILAEFMQQTQDWFFPLCTSGPKKAVFDDESKSDTNRHIPQNALYDV